MNDSAAKSNTSRANRMRPLRHKMPLWVKGFMVVAAVLVVTFAVLHFGGGTVVNHTP